MYHIMYIPKINKTQHPHYPQNCWRRSYWSLLVSSQHYPLGPYRIREIYRIYKVPLKEKSSQCPSYHKAFFLGSTWKGDLVQGSSGHLWAVRCNEEVDPFRNCGQMGARLLPWKTMAGDGHETHSKGLYTLYQPLSIKSCEDGVTIPQIAWHIW